MTSTQTECSSLHTVKSIEVSAGILGGDRGHKEPQRPQHHLEPGGRSSPDLRGRGKGSLLRESESILQAQGPNVITVITVSLSLPLGGERVKRRQTEPSVSPTEDSKSSNLQHCSKVTWYLGLPRVGARKCKDTGFPARGLYLQQSQNKGGREPGRELEQRGICSDHLCPVIQGQS